MVTPCPISLSPSNATLLSCVSGSIRFQPFQHSNCFLPLSLSLIGATVPVTEPDLIGAETPAGYSPENGYNDASCSVMRSCSRNKEN